MEEVDPEMVLHHNIGNLKLPTPAKSGAQPRLAAEIHIWRIWQPVQSRQAASVSRDIRVSMGLGKRILKWVKAD